MDGMPMHSSHFHPFTVGNADSIDESHPVWLDAGISSFHNK
jgi:hypothetical protein